MAKKKFSELPEAEELTLDEIMCVSQEIGDGLVSVQLPLIDLVSDSTFMGEIINNIEDVWVDTAGDRMTGTLEFKHNDTEGAPATVLQPLAGGSFNISQVDLDTSLYLGVSTADQTLGKDGSIVVGRFRSSRPVRRSVASGTTVYSSAYSSAIIEVAAGEGEHTIELRKNDGTAGEDFFVGNYIEVYGESDRVSLVPQGGNVHFLIPSGKLAATMGQYSTMRAVLVRADVTEVSPGVFTHDAEYWLISGDLADDLA